MTDRPGASPLLRAVLWMLGSLLSFATVAVGARELAGVLHTFQILNGRSVVGLVLVTVVALQRRRRLPTSGRWRLHVLRNSAHFVGQFGWFYAIGFIPLAAVFAVEMTTPLWTALLATVLLGERLSATRLLAIACGLLGVLVILRPGLAVVHPAAAGMLVCALAYGLTHTLTKKLSATDSALTILFYMMVIQCCISLVPALLVWRAPDWLSVVWLLIIGVAGLSAHYCLIRALLLADATLVIPMDFLRLPLIAVVGLLLYGEGIDRLLVVGSLLILAGLVVNLVDERRYRAAAAGGG